MLIDANRTGSRTQKPCCKPYPPGQRDQGLSFRIQIGSQEVQPSTTTSSQVKARHYSRASRKIHDSSDPGTSPVPSRVRQRHEPYADNGTTIKNKSTLVPSDPPGSRAVRRKVDIPQNGATDAVLAEEHLPRVVCSSSSIIHEPIPRRANKFMVLQWPPSDAEPERPDSVEVQVGRREPTVPASQAAENESWRKLVASSDRGSESTAQPSSHDASLIKLAISPGVSALPSHLGRDLPSLVGLLETSSPRSPYPATESREDLDQISLVNIPEEPPGHLNRPSSIDVHSNRHSTTSSRNSNGVGRLETTRSAPDLPHNIQVNSDKPDIAEIDEEQAWMDFVFDSNSDELRDRAFKDAEHKDAHDLKPSDTSDTTDNFSLMSNNSTRCASIPTAPTDDAHNSETAKVWDDISSQVFNKASPMTSDESRVATQGTTVLSSSSNEASSAPGRPIMTVPQQRSAATGFRFVAPKTFVGKLAGAVNNITPQAFQSSSTSVKRGKAGGRRKKKALDGRPSIRDLPNYDDDPIEEL